MKKVKSPGEATAIPISHAGSFLSAIGLTCGLKTSRKSPRISRHTIKLKKRF